MFTLPGWRENFSCFYENPYYNSKNFSENRIIISAPASLFSLVDFSPVPIPHWMQKKYKYMYVHVLGGFQYDISEP